MSLKFEHVRLGKCWQTDDVTLCWQIHAEEKCYLLLSAKKQKNHPFIRIVQEKPLTADSSRPLAALVRKYLPAGTPVFIGTSEKKELWLVALRPYEDGAVYGLRAEDGTLELLSSAGISLCRLQPQGTFTKRKTSEWVLPEPAQLKVAEVFLPTEKAPEPSEETTTPLFSNLQRQTRDQVARRLKTLKKTLTKHLSKAPDQQETLSLEEELHHLESGEDAAYFQAQNLGRQIHDRYEELKKNRRALSLATHYQTELEEQMHVAAQALEKLRSNPLSDQECQDIRTKFRLDGYGELKNKTKPLKSSEQNKKYCRRFMSSEEKIIYVGKSAADNDDLTRTASSKALWLHVVSGTGSHVVIPPSGKLSPQGSTVREAAILALHFSTSKEHREGEVYVTTRHHLRKPKGSPAGSWQVGRAERLKIHYTPLELQAIFAREVLL